MLCLPAGAAAQKAGPEQLLVAYPEGWRLGWQSERPALTIREFVPEGQSVEDWTDMITVQTRPGAAVDLEQFARAIEEELRARCGEFDVRGPDFAEEDGYPTVTLFADCRGPLSDPATPDVLLAPAEATLFKAVEGRDAFYVVIRSWHGPPDAPGNPAEDAEVMQAWQDFMDSITVCDSRRPGGACPALQP